MATIFIWKDNYVLPGVAHTFKVHSWSHQVIGHSSLHITDDWKPMLEKSSDGRPVWTDDSEAYVSYFKGGRQSHRKKKSKGYASKSLYYDICYEKYVPDNIIRLNIDEKNHKKMIKAWEKFKNKKSQEKLFKEKQKIAAKKGKKVELKDVTAYGPSYHMVAKNCSHAVARVLNEAIWFGQVANLFEKSFFSWPRGIAYKVRYTTAGFWGKTKTMKWDEFLMELHSKGAIKEKTLNTMKQLKKRQSNFGDSTDKSRFVYNEKKEPKDTGKNNYQFIIDEAEHMQIEHASIKARDLKVHLHDHTKTEVEKVDNEEFELSDDEPFYDDEPVLPPPLLFGEKEKHNQEQVIIIEEKERPIDENEKKKSTDKKEQEKVITTEEKKRPIFRSKCPECDTLHTQRHGNSCKEGCCHNDNPHNPVRTIAI
jgi:hypothetical protein